MIEKDIDVLLQKGEGKNLEFKEAQHALPSSVFETIVSFSNTSGGKLILGADDGGNVLGIDKNVVKKILSDLNNNIQNPSCIKPLPYVYPMEVNYRGKNILILDVRYCPEKCVSRESYSGIFGPFKDL